MKQETVMKLALQTEAVFCFYESKTTDPLWREPQVGIRGNAAVGSSSLALFFCPAAAVCRCELIMCLLVL